MKSMYLIVNEISSNNICENMERQDSQDLNPEVNCPSAFGCFKQNRDRIKATAYTEQMKIYNQIKGIY